MKKFFWITIVLLLSISVLVGYSRSDALLKEAESVMVSNLSKIVGAKVEVGDISWQIYPLPYLSYEEVKTNNGRVAELRVNLSPAALISGEIEPTSIEAKKGQINTRLLTHLISQGSGSDSSLNIKATSIVLTNDSGKKLGNYHVVIPPEGPIEIRRNKDQQIALNLQPQNGKYRDFSIQGKRWCFDLSRKPLCLNRLTAKGKHTAGNIRVNQFSGKSLGGNLSGNINLKQQRSWKLNGKIKLDKVDSQQLLQLVSSSGISGQLTGNVAISGQMKKLGSKLQGTRITGPFTLHSGKISKANLRKAAKFKPSSGATPFSRVSGNVDYRGKTVRLKKLHLTSNTLAATGHLRITNRRLKGELDVGLKGARELLSVPLDVSGTTDNPKVSPKPEVLAGAAAGTAILGPAGALLGTKVGAMVSRGVSQLKDKDAPVKKETKGNSKSPGFID